MLRTWWKRSSGLQPRYRASLSANDRAPTRGEDSRVGINVAGTAVESALDLWADVTMQARDMAWRETAFIGPFVSPVPGTRGRTNVCLEHGRAGIPDARATDAVGRAH